MRDRLSRTSVEREVAPPSMVFEGDTVGVEVAASECQVFRCTSLIVAMTMVLFVQIDTYMNNFAKVRLGGKER